MTREHVSTQDTLAHEYAIQQILNSNLYPFKLSCVSHAIKNICTAAIKNIRNMQSVSTDQIADALHFNDNPN